MGAFDDDEARWDVGHARGRPRSGTALARPGVDELMQALAFVREPLMVIDCFGSLRLANPALQALLGRTEAELRSMAVDRWLTLPSRPAAGGAAVLERARSAPGEQVDAQLEHADGRPIAARVRSTPLTNADGEQIMVCCAFDTGEPQVSGVLGVVGRLASEFAHDLNNHLSAVLNYSFILDRQLGTRAASEHLAELRAAAWRASRLAASLQRFGGTREPDREHVPLDDLVRRTVPIMRRVLGTATLDVTLDADLGETSAPATHVAEILVGLASHASGALGAVGRARLVGRAGKRGPRLSLELPATTLEGAAHRKRPTLPPGFRRAVKRSGARLERQGRRKLHVDLPEA